MALATRDFYAKELLAAAKPYLLMEKFGGAWQKRQLPWIMRVWPLKKFIRQWELVPPKLVASKERTIKFRRYHEPRRS